MASARLEVRLAPEHRRKLEEIAQSRRAPVSEVVRDLIDRAYDEVLRERRIRAAKAIGELQIEDVPDPETLGRQLDRTYEIPDLR